MMRKIIRITAYPVEMTAELNDTRTAQAIWDVLPITGKANLWGDEIYFSIPVNIEPEEGKETVNVGDLGYWPTGSAFCIFFGPTPMSRGDEVRPASAVNVFGKVNGDAAVFKQVASGTEVTIEKGSE
ncbi:cyclophilin-like fold protein [Chloroflexota bacterium]